MKKAAPAGSVLAARIGLAVSWLLFCFPAGSARFFLVQSVKVAPAARVRKPDVSILTASIRVLRPSVCSVRTGRPAAHLFPRLTSTSPSSLPPATARCNYCNCCDCCRLPATAATTPALLLRTKEVALSASLLVPCSLKYSSQARPRHRAVQRVLGGASVRFCLPAQPPAIE